MDLWRGTSASPELIRMIVDFKHHFLVKNMNDKEVYL